MAKGRLARRQMWTGLGFVSPWLIGFCLFTAVPVALSLYYSLTDYSLLNRPVWVGVGNYADLMWAPDGVGGRGDPVFWKVMANTAYYAMLALPAGMAVSLGLALLLNISTPGQSLYRTIVFLPSLVPMVASAMLWLWLFNADLGLINSLLRQVGIEGPGWLTQQAWAMPAGSASIA